MNCLEFQSLINIKYLEYLNMLLKNKLISNYDIDINKLKIYITLNENSNILDINKNILDVHKQYFLYK